MSSGASVDYVKELVWDVVVKWSLNEFFLAFPKLAWGPFAAVINWIVFRYADKLYVIMSKIYNMKLLVFQNESLQKEFTSSVLTLQKIAFEKGILSDEFKESRNENKKHLEPFVRYAIARAS